MDDDICIEHVEDGVLGNSIALQSFSDHETSTTLPVEFGGDNDDWNEADELRQTQSSVLNFLPSRQLSIAEVSLQRRRSKRSKHRHTVRRGSADDQIDGNVNTGTIRSVEDLDRPGDEKRHPKETTLKRQETLKKLSSKIHDKRVTMKQIKDSQPREDRGEGRITCWTAFQYRFSVGWKHFKDRMSELKYHLTLWAGHIKQVESHFGTGIVSYFVFLRWVFLVNLLLCLLWVFFVVIPHAVISGSNMKLGNFTQPDIKMCIADVGVDCGVVDSTNGFVDCLDNAANNTAASEVQWYDYFVSAFTGVPPLEDTSLFMGAYENTKLVDGSNSYDLPLAYVIIGGIFFFASLFLLVIKMASAYRQNFVEGLSTGKKSPFFNMVFTAWDFSITNMQAARMKHLSIKTDLEEVISSQRDESKQRDTLEFCQIWLTRILIHFAILVLLALAGAAIYYAAEVSLDATVEQVDLSTFNFGLIIRQLAASLTISVFNVIYPFVFELLVPLEHYRSPTTEFTWTILRSVALRVSGLVVLMATVLRQVECSDNVKACGKVIAAGSHMFNSSIEAFIEKQTNCKLCWETYIGQEVYRLLIIDFLFEVLATIGVESIRHLLVNRIRIVREKLGKAEFIIAKSVLGLVYMQALIWLGAFYAPLIPPVGVMLLFILFYVKKYSLIWNCQPSSRAYRASRTNIFFLSLLLVALFGCLIPVGYSMVEIRPSQTCGPFRTRTRVYDVVSDEIDKSPSWFQGLLDYIGSAAFVIPLVVLLCLIAFYFFALSRAYRTSIRILNDQLQWEGRDKQFLIKAVKDHERHLLSSAGSNGIRRIANVRNSAAIEDGNGSQSATSTTQITVKPLQKMK